MAGCNCGNEGNSEVKTRRVYSCSGCADVGELADRVARKLRKGGFADPTSSCLVGIGANIESFINAAKEVNEVVAIDGCPMLCAKKIMDQAGIDTISYALTDFGLKKGQTTVTEDVIGETAGRIMLLHNGNSIE